MSEIPVNFVVEFWRAFPEPGPHSFADPGEDFQATDVIDGRELPRRRLLFGGRSASIAFVYYEKGGYALGRHVVVACSDGGPPRLFSCLLPPKAGDASSLFERLSSECVVTPPREHLEKTDRCVR